MTARKRYELLGANERALWLDPAEIEFCTNGFEAASLNRVIAAAGESKGRTYHYFENKGELFRATFERCLERHEDLDELLEIAIAADGDAFWAQLQTLNSQLTAMLQDDETLAAMLRTLHQEIAAQTACAILIASFRQTVEAVLAAGQRVGAIREDLPLGLMSEIAMSMLISVDGWFSRNSGDMAPEQETELSHRAFDMLMAPFRPAKPEGIN